MSLPSKSTVAWVCAMVGTGCAAYVAAQQGGVTAGVGAVGAAFMSAAALLGYQANKPF